MLTISLMSSNVPGTEVGPGTPLRVCNPGGFPQVPRTVCRWRRHGTSGSAAAEHAPAATDSRRTLWRPLAHPPWLPPAHLLARPPWPLLAQQRRSSCPGGALAPMFPWRLLGAIALSFAFLLMGREIRLLATDQPWSDANMWWSIIAGAVAGACVLMWTWFTALNARRLVEPARSRELPDPKKAVGAWLVPFAFVGVAVGVVASLGEQISRTADDAGVVGAGGRGGRRAAAGHPVDLSAALSVVGDDPPGGRPLGPALAVDVGSRRAGDCRGRLDRGVAIHHRDLGRHGERGSAVGAALARRPRRRRSVCDRRPARLAGGGHRRRSTAAGRRPAPRSSGPREVGR